MPFNGNIIEFISYNFFNFVNGTLLTVASVLGTAFIDYGDLAFVTPVNFHNTVQVSYEGKVYVGSAIWRTDFFYNNGKMSPEHIQPNTYGEAIPVEVPGYGTVFALSGYGSLLGDCISGGVGLLERMGQYRDFKGPCETTRVSPLVEVDLSNGYPNVEFVHPEDNVPVNIGHILERSEGSITTEFAEKFPWVMQIKERKFSYEDDGFYRDHFLRDFNK